jgi:hypothetical protein
MALHGSANSRVARMTVHPAVAIADGGDQPRSCGERHRSDGSRKVDAPFCCRHHAVCGPRLKCGLDRRADQKRLRVCASESGRRLIPAARRGERATGGLADAQRIDLPQNGGHRDRRHGAPMPIKLEHLLARNICRKMMLV